MNDELEELFTKMISVNYPDPDHFFPRYVDFYDTDDIYEKIRINEGMTFLLKMLSTKLKMLHDKKSSDLHYLEEQFEKDISTTKRQLDMIHDWLKNKLSGENEPKVVRTFALFYDAQTRGQFGIFPTNPGIRSKFDELYRHLIDTNEVFGKEYNELIESVD